MRIKRTGAKKNYDEIHNNLLIDQPNSKITLIV